MNLSLTRAARAPAEWLAVVCLLSSLIIAGAGRAQTPPLSEWAPTPPMGWNSWDAFGGTVTEAEVRANADYMAANLKQYGWDFVVVDIHWTAQNASQYSWTDLTLDANGRFIPAPNRFPSSAGGQGFKPLADYVHSLGLKFGIHIMRGMPRIAYDTPPNLPNGYPIAGSNYYTKDIVKADQGAPWLQDMYGVAQTPAGQAYYDSMLDLYSSWGVDLVKMDDVMLGFNYHGPEIEMLRSAIDKTGKQILFSSSPGGPPGGLENHIVQNTNMWRIAGDFWDEWGQLYYQIQLFDRFTPWRTDGHWQDGDMLPLGWIGTRSIVGPDRMTKFTHNEQRTLVSLWSIARSPLMFGGDLTRNDAWTNSLITNPEVIAIDQDSSNNHQLFRIGDRLAWVADKPGGGKYLALFNAADEEKKLLKAAAASAGNGGFVSNVITRNTPAPQSFSVDITGKDRLYLLVDEGEDGLSADWSDWVNVQLHGPGGTIPITDLDWIRSTAGFGTSKENHNIIGGSLVVNGTTYASGIGTHASSFIEYALPPGYTSVTGLVGLDLGGTSQSQFFPSVQFIVAARNGPYGDTALDIGVNLADLGFTGNVRVRDLWARSDIGTFAGQFSQSIPWHGVGLYSLTATTSLLGDYNNNGTVDVADYLVWRKLNGSNTSLEADGNGDLVVDDLDYEVWRAHFGESANGTGAGSNQSVPEPGSSAILISAAVLARIMLPLCRNQRRNRSRSRTLRASGT